MKIDLYSNDSVNEYRVEVMYKYVYKNIFSLRKDQDVTHLLDILEIR